MNVVGIKKKRLLTMPIDDALETLEGVPEYVLENIPKIELIIPKTLAELEEKYSDYYKFWINKLEKDYELRVLPNQKYKDILNTNTFELQYVCNIYDNKEVPFEERKKFVILYHDNTHETRQSAHISKNKFRKYMLQSVTHNSWTDDFRDETPENIRKLNKSEKKSLRDWFYKTEESILKDIPELKEFIEKYKIKSDEVRFTSRVVY
jgi:hypothetical protein